MAAGIRAPCDKYGGETADLIHNGWPLRVTDSKPREFFTTAHTYGVHVGCNAENSYEAPAKPAGQSKRISAFYQKTGVMQHRTEPGFRDTKGGSALTEVPMPEYGTLRKSSRLPGTASMVLGASTGSVPTIRAPSERMEIPPQTGGSGRSRASRASSYGSRQSFQSDASRPPSWVLTQPQRKHWNFEPLPMYERTNATYGKDHRAAARNPTGIAAGKSESGFLDSADLIATLTRPV